MMDWTSGKLSGLLDAACPSLFAGVVGASAAAALPDGGGVASPEDPAGALFPLDPPVTGGGAPGAGVDVVLPGMAGAPAGGVPGTVGTSLPRMIGSPSLPEPMITILVLGDCANASVASMPRQRRYRVRISLGLPFFGTRRCRPPRSVCASIPRPLVAPGICIH